MKCRLYYLGGLETEATNSLVIEFDKQMMIFNFGRGRNPGDVLGVSRNVADYEFIAKKKQEGFSILGLFACSSREKHIGGVPYLIDLVKTLRIFGTAATCDTIARYTKNKNQLDLEKGNKTLNVMKSGESVTFIKEEDKKSYTQVFNHKINNIAFGAGVEVVAFQTLSGVIDSCGFYVKVYDQAFCITGEVFFGPQSSPSSYLDLDTLTAQAKLHPPILLSLDTSNTFHKKYTAPEHQIYKLLREEVETTRDQNLFLVDIEEDYRFIELLKCANDLNKSIYLEGSSLCQHFNFLRRSGELEEFAHLEVKLSIEQEKGFQSQDDFIVFADTFDRIFEKVYVDLEGDNNSQIQQRIFEKIILIITDSPIREVKMQNMISQLSKYAYKVFNVGGKDRISPKGSLMDILLLQNILLKQGFIIGENTQEKVLVNLDDHFKNQNNLTLLKLDDFIAIDFERNRLLKKKNKIDATHLLLSADGASNHITTKILRHRRTLAESGIIVVTFLLNSKNKLIEQSIDIETRGIFPTKEMASSTKRDLRSTLTTHNSKVMTQDVAAFKTDRYQDEVKEIISKFINKIIKKKSIVMLMIGKN